jgi:large subunit ribosomal protein L1
MSKRTKEANNLAKKTNYYNVDSGISFFTKNYSGKHNARFVETVECIIQLGIDKKQITQGIRGTVIMPNNVTAKKKKVALIIDESRTEESQLSEADFIGAEDLVQKIKGGFLDFDACVVTHSMINKVATIAKLLGPRGLMPSVKLGTVTDDFIPKIKDIKRGQLHFKTDKAGIIHAPIAKISSKENEIKNNLKTLLDEVLLKKPLKHKGSYKKKLFLSCTHGPSIELDVKSLLV